MEFKPANLRFRLNKGKSLDLIEKTPFLPSKFLSLQISANRVHFSLQRLTKHKLSLYFRRKKPSFISQMTTMPPAYYLKRWNSKIFARAFTAEINHSKLA
jgi:hypothetical protein